MQAAKEQGAQMSRADMVAFVLRCAEKPLRPIEIARRIDEPWCSKGYGVYLPSAILPHLQCIGAKRLDCGRYAPASD